MEFPHQQDKFRHKICECRVGPGRDARSFFWGAPMEALCESCAFREAEYCEPRAEEVEFCEFLVKGFPNKTECNYFCQEGRMFFGGES